MVVLHGGALLLDPTMHFGLPRRARARDGAVAAAGGRGRRRRRLADARARGLVPRPAPDRRSAAGACSTTQPSPASRSALGHALTAGTDLRGEHGPGRRRARRRTGALADLRADPDAASAPPARRRRPPAATPRCQRRRAARPRRRWPYDRRAPVARAVPRDGHVCEVAVTAGPCDAAARPGARSRPARAEVDGLRAGALALRPGQRPVAPERRRRRVGRTSTSGSSRRSRVALARAGGDRRDGSTRRSCPALAAAGYDRSFEQLDERPAGRATAGARAPRSSSTRPAAGLGSSAGAAVDLGGIGKGFAATRALRGDARGLAGAARRARRPRRRHRRLGPTARGRPLAARHRRPARAGAQRWARSRSRAAASRRPGATPAASARAARSTT